VNEFANRKIYITGFFILVFAIILGRLFYVQIIDSNYKQMAKQNVLRYEILYPARGLIFDRNGTLLVGNQTVYDIMVIPREVAAFDTAALAKTLDMTEKQVHITLSNIKEKAKKTASYQPTLFRRQISSETFALLQEKWFKFPGFYAQARSIRAYPRKLAATSSATPVKPIPPSLPQTRFTCRAATWVKSGLSVLTKTYCVVKEAWRYIQEMFTTG